MKSGWRETAKCEKADTANLLSIAFRQLLDKSFFFPIAFAKEVLNYSVSASGNSSCHERDRLLGFCLGMGYPSRVLNYLCS